MIVVSTSLLVSTGAVSCYRALMVKFIWFTDENFPLCQHLTTWGMKSGVRDPKTQRSHKRCVLVHCPAWKV